MPVRLFVGNLPYDATEAELREHFSPAGQLSYIHMPTDRETGKPRGFAFVEFRERPEAEEAIRRFNSQPFKGRPLAVNEARAREERPQGSAPPRAPTFRSAPTTTPGGGNLPAVGGDERQFGPDAQPRRMRSKAKGRPKAERVPKGPMREVVSSRYFGGSEDDDPFLDDLDGENFAERVQDDEFDQDS